MNSSHKFKHLKVGLPIRKPPVRKVVLGHPIGLPQAWPSPLQEDSRIKPCGKQRGCPNRNALALCHLARVSMFYNRVSPEMDRNGGSTFYFWLSFSTTSRRVSFKHTHSHLQLTSSIYSRDSPAPPAAMGQKGAVFFTGNSTKSYDNGSKLYDKILQARTKSSCFSRGTPPTILKTDPNCKMV